MRIWSVFMFVAGLAVAGPAWTELGWAAPTGPGTLDSKLKAPLNRDAETGAQTRRRHALVGEAQKVLFEYTLEIYNVFFNVFPGVVMERCAYQSAPSSAPETTEPMVKGPYDDPITCLCARNAAASARLCNGFHALKTCLTAASSEDEIYDCAALAPR